MTSWPVNIRALDDISAALISWHGFADTLQDALKTHLPWVAVVRNAPVEEVRASLAWGADADVIVMVHRRLLANLLPDAVCWRRDTLAAVLASASGVPAMFQLLRRAEVMGARVVHLPLAEHQPVGGMWAGATHR